MNIVMNRPPNLQKVDYGLFNVEKVIILHDDDDTVFLYQNHAWGCVKSIIRASQIRQITYFAHIFSQKSFMNQKKFLFLHQEKINRLI